MLLTVVCIAVLHTIYMKDKQIYKNGTNVLLLRKFLLNTIFLNGNA